MRKWFEALEREARFFFCRFPQIGLLRLLTDAAFMGQYGVIGQADRRKSEGERLKF